MKGQHEQQCIALDEIKQGRLAKIAGLGADNEEACRYAAYVHNRGCNCAHGMFWKIIREPGLFVGIHNSARTADGGDESGQRLATQKPTPMFNLFITRGSSMVSM